MRYIVDTDSNSGFIQIIGIPESRMMGEYPLAFQVRGGVSILESLESSLQQAIAHIEHIDDLYHYEAQAKVDYHQGMVVFTPGYIPITLVIQQRMVTVLIGSRQLGDGPVRSVDQLLSAVQEAIAKAESV